MGSARRDVFRVVSLAGGGAFWLYVWGFEMYILTVHGLYNILHHTGALCFVDVHRISHDIFPSWLVTVRIFLNIHVLKVHLIGLH